MGKDKKSRFRKYGLIVILAVVILAVLGSSSSKKQEQGKQVVPTATNASVSEDSTSVVKSSIPKIGDPARDGKFEFVVKSIDCGHNSVGTNPYLTKQAQGQYCFLNISIKNIGDEAQSIYSGNQKLLNAQNQQFSPDDTATTYLENNSIWYTDINPGNSIEGTLVFDLPKDQSPVKAELHDSSLSGGVKVSLQ